jgi:hypothetical protein
MTIQALATAIDTALGNLVTAIDALAAQAKTNDQLYRAQNHGHPSPNYESIRDKIVFAAASYPTLTKYMGMPVKPGATTLAALFPAGD